jgi:hypothetical protein
VFSRQLMTMRKLILCKGGKGLAIEDDAAGLY